MNILALDIGTKMGFAYNQGGNFQCGTWVLATPKEIKIAGQSRMSRRNDPRIKKLCEILSGLPGFDVVVFEDVMFSSYTLQVQLWSSLRATVNLCAKTKHFECVPVSTLKKFATGFGNATKEMMRGALERSPDFWRENMPKDDNGVDAVWLHLWAQKNLGRMAP